MTDTTQPEPERNYLKSAISRIYCDDDDFILLGLTGRTGSGCSTAANILLASQTAIKHSLFNGGSPKSNEERKERIIGRYFDKNWEPFLLIQVRSIITTFLLDYDISRFDKLYGYLIQDAEKKNGVLNILETLQSEFRNVANSTDPVAFYTKTLPSLCDELKSLLGDGVFVRIYQEIGRNIRISGDPYDENLKDGQFFTLAERINDVVKLIKVHRKRELNKTFIVIDAIRSPLEAIFFQDRYASFFLVAISSPEDDRKRRLRELRYSDHDIKSLDSTEYVRRDLDVPGSYSVQDIKACLQRADLYISNPDVVSKVNEFQNLSNQLIKFVSLIRRPGMVTPSPEERCMQIAYTAKLNSGCISRQVGAVVTDQNYSIRSIGWNDAPQGQVPCNLRNRDDLINGHDSIAYSFFEKNDKAYLEDFKTNTPCYSDISSTGRNVAFCFKSEYIKHTKKENQVHTRSLHAEENAFLQISKYGSVGIEGGILFTTASPCELCAKKAYQLGMTDIVYIDPYPGIAMTHILQGGSNNPVLRIFSGAIGRAFHKLYTPIVAYKDETNALTKDTTDKN